MSLERAFRILRKVEILSSIVLTRNRGLVVRLGNGTEYQIPAQPVTGWAYTSVP
jgi:hypothetical protein